MLANIILMGISVLLLIACVIMIPVWKKSIKKKSGKLLSDFSVDKRKTMIVVDIMCLLLVLSTLRVQYTFFIQLILCGCAVAGAFICNKEYLISSIAGIYENGFAGASNYVSFIDIVSCKDISEKKANTIFISSRNGKKYSLTFIDDNEFRVYLKVLKDKKMMK